MDECRLGAELDLVRRALPLRKKGRIGVLYSGERPYYIASDEMDPYGTRVRVSVKRLRQIVDAAEIAEARERRPGPAREISVEIS